MQNLVVYIRLKLRSMLLAAGLSGNENNKEPEFEIMMRIVFFKATILRNRDVGVQKASAFKMMKDSFLWQDGREAR